MTGDRTVKIKICGLKRPDDIGYVNEALPDYAGFVVEVPGSRRSVDLALIHIWKTCRRPRIWNPSASGSRRSSMTLS